MAGQAAGAGAADVLPLPVVGRPEPDGGARDPGPAEHRHQGVHVADRGVQAGPVGAARQLPLHPPGRLGVGRVTGLDVKAVRVAGGEDGDGQQMSAAGREPPLERGERREQPLHVSRVGVRTVRECAHVGGVIHGESHGDHRRGAAGLTGPKTPTRAGFITQLLAGRGGRGQGTASASYSPGGWPAGSRCLATREVGVRGRSSTACQKRGTLYAASRPATCARSCAKSSCAPGAGTTNAFTSSSDSSEGTPTTAHSSTDGWLASASSTSAGERFSPRRRRTSFFLATNVYVPASSAVTRSPVCSQPSLVIVSAVSSGMPQ